MEKDFLQNLFVKKLLLIICIFFFFSCENHHFDKDTRQIMAKDEIMNKLHKAKSFDVTGFKEDTVENTTDSNFKKVIRYTLDIQYLDSNNVLQKKSGIVFFTPDGKSIIHSQITER